MTSRVRQARNLAHTICMSVSGRVSRKSIVPVRFSSANERMVMAGTKKRNRNCDRLKSPCKSASPDSTTLFTFGKTQMKSPATIRKTPMKIYPMMELKNAFSSLMYRLNIPY